MMFQTDQVKWWRISTGIFRTDFCALICTDFNVTHHEGRSWIWLKWFAEWFCIYPSFRQHAEQFAGSRSSSGGHREASSLPLVPAHNAGHGELLLFTPRTVSDTPGSCSERSPKIRTSYMSEAAEAPLDRESATGLEFQVGKGEEWNGNSSQALCFQNKVF